MWCPTCDDAYDCELDRDADDYQEWWVWEPCPRCGWMPEADDIQAMIDGQAESLAQSQAEWLM